MAIQSYAPGNLFIWVAVAFLAAAPTVAQAREWWVLEPDGTCQNPHVYTSPADQIKTLTREGNTVEVKKTEFPDGSFALILTFAGGKNLWVTSQQTCNFVVAVLRPNQIDTDWNDFQ